MSIIYLTMADVVAIHARQLELFAGADGVRDAGLIEAALQRPQSGYYSDIVEEAAALWESLSMNHGFVDGNKRIGFAAAYTFLALNEVIVEGGGDEPADFVLKAMFDGTFNKDSIEDWLHRHIKK